jgi:hypothetical protein
MNLLEQGSRSTTKTARWPSPRRPSTPAASCASASAGPSAPAGGLEASRRLRPQQGHGPLRAAQHPHLPDAAAAGLALHRPHVRRRRRQLLRRSHYHPEAASAASFEKLLAYFLGFLLIDFVTSSLAFSLERRHPANKGDGWLLFHIWLQRFAYRQVFSIVLFKTLKRAIDGKPFNWDKKGTKPAPCINLY